MKRTSGSVLVMALWGLSLLTLFAVSLGFGVRQKAALLNRLTTLDALYPIAYSGVEDAKSLVRSDANTDVDTLADPWAAVASQRIDLPGGYFFIGNAAQPGLVDEERKINLNAATPEMLVKVFQGAGLDQSKAEETAYCVLDWMDSDSFFGHPQYGAEDAYYEELRTPYEAKDLPYESMDELLLVKGVTEELLKQISPYVTVYGAGQVNINTAPRLVLGALGFNAKGVETIAVYRAGPDGKDGTPDDNYFLNATTVATDIGLKGSVPLDNDQVAVLNGLVAASKIGVTSRFFSVRTHAVLERNGASMDVDAVVDRAGHVHYCRASEVKF